MSSRITVSGPTVDGLEEILTPGALDLLADLHDRFAGRRAELLAERQRRRDAVAVGEPLDFLPETAEIRSGVWSVAEIPAYLADRRVEITGPTDRKMTIKCAQLRGQDLARRPGGREHPGLGERDFRPAEST